MDRSSGVLMAMSSLPSPYGIGTMGKSAYEFVDFLKAAGQKYWQLLPLGPSSAGDSPYSSYDDFEFKVPVCQNGDVFDRVVVREGSLGRIAEAVETATSGTPTVYSVVPKYVWCASSVNWMRKSSSCAGCQSTKSRWMLCTSVFRSWNSIS